MTSDRGRAPLTGVAYEEALAAQASAARGDTVGGSTVGGFTVGGDTVGGSTVHSGRRGPGAAPFDPLRLCVYTTVALLGWLLGPLAVLGFAVVGFAGYVRARRAGLVRSKCLLRDTRLVLAYLALIVVAAVAAIVLRFFT